MKRLNIPFICHVHFLRGTVLINPPLIEHHHTEKSGESHTQSSKTNLHQCKGKKCFRVAQYQVLNGGSGGRPLLVLDQTKARMAEKKCFLRPPPPPLSEVWIRHRYFVSTLKRFGCLSRRIKRGEIGHLQLAIHVVQSWRAVEQK